MADNSGRYGALSGAPSQGYISPISSIYGTHVTSPFGGRASPMGIGSTNHKGADMRGTDARGQVGYAVNAVADGRVETSGQRGGYGLAVTVVHDDGMKSLYGHLNSLSVKTGDRVAQGVPIGTLGNTGRSTGPHLHFELMDPLGRQVDPMAFMSLTNQGIPTPVAADRAAAVAAQVAPSVYGQAAQSMQAAGLLGMDGRAATQGLDPAAAYGQLSQGLGAAGLLGVDGRAAAPASNMSIAAVGPGPQSAAANYGQMAASMGAAGLLGTDGRAAAPSQNMSVANMSTGPSVNVATDAAMANDMEAALAAVDPAFGMQGVPTQSVQSVSFTPASVAAAQAAQNTAAANQGMQATNVAANTSFAGQPSGLGPSTSMNGLGNPMSTPAMMAADQAITAHDKAQASMYGQMATTMGQAGLLGLDGRAAVAPAAVAPVAQQVAPAQTLAPALSAPRSVESRTTMAAVPAAPPATVAPSQSFPTAPSMPTGLDAINGVFNGTVAQAGSRSHPGTTFTAMGNGMVSKTDAYGNTTYSQAALGPAGAGLQGNIGNFGALSGGLLGGIGNIGQGLAQGLGGINAGSIGRGAVGMGAGMAGSMLGSALGPVGSIVGGLLGRGIANQVMNNVGRNTQMTVTGFGQNAFPSAPAAPPGFMGDSYSSLSYSDMAAISPGAAAAISAGSPGLY